MTTINSFVHNLRHTMVMEEPSVVRLESWLDQRLEMFKSRTEKLELLNEVAKLNIPRVLDVYYLEEIQPFFNYVKHKIMTLAPGKLRKELTFEDLFRDKANALKVKKIFETNGYTLNGKWQGLSNDKSELLYAYHVLKPLLKPIKDTPAARIFYYEFGLTVGPEKEGNYITTRTFPDVPKNHKLKEFEAKFQSLLLSE